MCTQVEEVYSRACDADVQRKVLHCRRLMILVADVLQADHDYRLDGYDADDDVDPFTRQLISAKECWCYMQQMLSDTAELAVRKTLTVIPN